MQCHGYAYPDRSHAVRLLMPVVAALTLACSLGTQPGPGQHHFLIPPGEVELAEGQAVEVGLPNAPSTLFITFDRVSSDSRCPADVQCVWAGDAAVLLSLSGEASGEVTLHFPTATVGPTSAEIGQYRIELKAVAPTPLIHSPRPRRYRITLAISWRE